MKTCFLSIDVEPSSAQTKVGATEAKEKRFESVENLDNMLDIFKKHKADATLFVTGEVLKRRPDLVKKWTKDFEIGCHNYFHRTLDKIDSIERERQIKDFIELYEKILNKKPRGFRAPRNIIDNDQFPILEKYAFLYDSSVFPRYPWPVQRYEGYKGRAPVEPYWPNRSDYKKKSPSTALGATSELLEIPETPITFWGLPIFNVPLVATWLRKWGPKIFKIIFFFRKPKYISFNMHSWDGVKFKGKGSRNSGQKFLKQLDEMLGFLKKIGYEFKRGEQIYEEFFKNK